MLKKIIGLLLLLHVGKSVKAAVKNSRGSVEKLSSKESFEGANTVLRGSVRALEKLVFTLYYSTV